MFKMEKNLSEHLIFFQRCYDFNYPPVLTSDISSYRIYWFISNYHRYQVGGHSAGYLLCT